MATPRLFQPASFGALTLRNRVVMAPMTRRFAADDGIPTDDIVAYYRRRAAGEVGLIISEGTGIDSQHAYDTLTVPRFETDEQLAGWRRVVDAVHEQGGAFAPQLWHTGRLAHFPIGPSEADMGPRKDGTPRPRVKAMDAADFAQVLGAFERSAAAAREIGCDALEIHGAHGYLLDSFLSASTNHRTDEYGGSVENRMRFPLEVVRTVRRAAGPDYPVIYRFSQWRIGDSDEVKFETPADLEQWVTALRDAGVDILHVSTPRATEPGFPELAAGPAAPADSTGLAGSDASLTLAGWSQKLSGLPAIAVGSVTATTTMTETRDGAADVVADPGPAIDLVERGEVELLAVGRALIGNPDWVKTVRDGDWHDLAPYDASLLETLV
jgi:2,4-dienoyl-CoA reductase-like NADH-dependent reductase (Old Yellow Enzyme family)